jgi:hypothetical protein
MILRVNRVDGVSLYSTTQEGLHVGIAEMIGPEMMDSPPVGNSLRSRDIKGV